MFFILGLLSIEKLIQFDCCKGHLNKALIDKQHVYVYCLLYPPQTVFVGGYTVFTLSESPSDRPTDRVSETFCFFNNFKNH